MLVSQNQEKDIKLCRCSIVLTVNIGLSGVKIQFILGISNKAPATFLYITTQIEINNHIAPYFMLENLKVIKEELFVATFSQNHN